MSDETTATPTFDLDSLTIGDLEDIENATGKSFTELFPDGQPSMTGLAVIVWLVRRETQPDYTLEDARSLKVSELQTAVQFATPDPTDAAG